MIFASALFPQQKLIKVAKYIKACQDYDGFIPWYPNVQGDPWNHVESAMGLAACGFLDEARAAYEWLARMQLPNGSWFASYFRSHAENPLTPNASHIEPHFVAYIATGVWHYYLVSGEQEFLRRFWPSVNMALKFVLLSQTSNGVFPWAYKSLDMAQEDALVTSCCSIYKSLECGLRIATELGEQRVFWQQSRARLGAALRHHPENFNQLWKRQDNYAMDWFYPVLVGLMDKKSAWLHLQQKLNKFVIERRGCLCVLEQPWVTIAESCELVMALLACGQRGIAEELFSWLDVYVEPDGGPWMGYVYKECALWPLERPTWTAGAMLLAADALAGQTKSGMFFINTLSESIN